METRNRLGGAPAFTLNNLCVSFNGTRILRGVTTTIERNRATFILGRSGAGKTTLLRALNRLNESFDGCRTKGGVHFHEQGRKISLYRDEMPLTELRRKVGMVFQSPNVLPMSVLENIVMPLMTVTRLSRADAEAEAERALQEAHLWEEVKFRQHESALQLSGGQQQRLCLARTLALRPDVLLLDEPTASLDYRAARKIEELIQELKEKYTLVVVSHSLEGAARLADTLIVLKDGRLARKVERHDLPGIAMTLESWIDNLF